jgi:serine protease inhibitor/membrane protease YdiL (CAAX protease family)
MLNNPEIEQRLFIIAYAILIGTVFSFIGWKNGFFQLDPSRGSGGIGIRLPDVFKIFGIFLSVELFFIPSLAILWIIFQTGHFSITTTQSLHNTETKGWFNLLTIFTASLAVIGYCFAMDPQKRRAIFWGSSERSATRLINNLGVGSLTWLFSYPFVITIGQLAGVITLLLGFGQHTEQVAVKHLKETMQYPSLFALTVFAVIFLVPIAEEVLFRGFFQKWLIPKCGRFKGVILTSIIFASFHFSFSQKWDNIELLLSLFILSCVLGYIYEKQGTLWAPIGLHMTFNAVSIFIILTVAPAAILAQSMSVDEETKEAPPTKEMIESYLHSTIQGNNAFAFDLYAKLKGTSGNLCFSPYSLSSAIALPFMGSKGATQSDMRIVMHYLNKADQVIEIYGILDKLYTTPWYLGQNESRLFLGNSLWLQRDIKILPAFLDSIPAFYRPAIKIVDFIRNSEGARLNINEWVREKTQGRIAKQVGKEDVSRNTEMLVISSIFMKGVWSIPFNPSLSKESPFFIDRLTTGSVNMMLTSGKFRLYKTNEFTLLEIPYRPNFKGIPTFALMIVLPASNFGLASIEQKFYLEQWNSWVAQLREEGVVVSLPAFSFLQSFDLSSLLKGMGMSFAFSDQADFTGLSAKEDFSISGIIHEAYFAVDERGSDAIVANPISMNEQPLLSKTPTYSFTADHPFLFLVVDKTNNTIIYVGRFVKP